MTAAALRSYDPRSALAAFAPGLLMTRELEQALVAQFIANGNTPLTQGQVLAIAGTPPAYPSGLPRFADSNPDPVDGWSIDYPGRYSL